MPSTDEHRTRAAQNLSFAQSFDLNTTPYLDWVVTAYFYAALHLVDALLAHKDNFHPDDHEVRRDCVKKRYYLCGIRNEYRKLKDLSEDARYRLTTFTSLRVEREVIPLYRAIEEHITQQLKSPRR